MAENKYLRSMQQAKAHLGQSPEQAAQSITDEPAAPVAKARGVGRPPGKRSNPDWEQVTIFVRKDTKRAALRRLMDDQSPLDLSEVIEQLLAKWAKQS